MVLVLSLAIILPAIIWTIVILFGSNATGLTYHLQFFAANRTMVALQSIENRHEQTKSIIHKIVICFQILQFFATFLFYSKILYIAYMSTTKVATRTVMEDNLNEPTNEIKRIHATTDKSNDCELEIRQTGNMSNKEIPGSSKTFYQAGQNYNDPENVRPESRETNDGTSLDLMTTKDNLSRANAKRKIDTPRDESMLHGSGNTSQSPKSTVKMAELCSNEITKREDDIKVVDMKNNFIGKPHNIKSLTDTTINGSYNKNRNVTKNETIYKKKSPKEFVNSDGTKTVIQPKIGDRVINVPYTNAVVCISQKDIVCTIGLSCQLTILIITFILCSFCFRMTGKIVPLSEFFQGLYSLEIGFILNSMVNPVVCVIFSTNFREAFKSMMTIK